MQRKPRLVLAQLVRKARRLTSATTADPPADRLPYHVALERDVKEAGVGDSWHLRISPSLDIPRMQRVQSSESKRVLQA